MKRQKDRILKDELPRSVGAQYATGKEWRNNFRKNEDLSVSISKANHSILQESKSMPQPVMLKKMKLNGSMMTYNQVQLTPKNKTKQNKTDVLFIIGDWNAKVGS